MLTRKEKEHLSRLGTAKARENFKIGKEICRMSKSGEKGRHKELAKDFKRVNEQKQSNGVAKEITRDIMRQLGRS